MNRAFEKARRFRVTSIFCGSIFLSLSLSLSSNMRAQDLPSLPDSLYVKDEVLVWFHEGELNPAYLGCGILNIAGKIPRVLSDDLPLNTDFIYSQQIVDFLSAIGVAEIRKVIPGINPCADIFSIARTGDTLWMPDFWNALSIRFQSDQNIPLVVYTLMSLFHGQILWAQPDFIFVPFERRLSQPGLAGGGPVVFSHLNALPNDPLFANRQLTLRDTIGMAYLDSAWLMQTGDSSIRIGILDRGIDCRHPDLGNGVAPNGRFKGGWEYGWNDSAFWENRGFENGKAWVIHGTNVAGIAGAMTNNSVGIAGAAGGDGANGSGASMIGLSVFNSRDFAAAVWEAAATPKDTFPSGFQYVRSGNLWHCQVLNCSAGFSYGVDNTGYLTIGDEIVRAAVGFAYQNGCVFVNAMGNAGFEHILEDVDVTFGGYPMDVDEHWVIDVSANDEYRLQNNGYDYGKNLDLLAPPFSYSTTPLFSGSALQGYDYQYFSGSSSSAPIVAGVAALLLSHHKELLPIRDTAFLPDVLAPEDVDWLMKESAQRDPKNSYPVLTDGWGVIHARDALLSLQAPFRLRHFEGLYTGDIVDPGVFDTLEIVFPGYKNNQVRQPLENGNNSYQVKRFHLMQQVPYGATFTEVRRAWGRGTSKTGYNWSKKIRKMKYRIPLYRVGYCELVDNTFDLSQCTLETNVYLARKIDAQGNLSSDSVWIPCPPDQVRFAGSVLARDAQTSVEEVSTPGDFAISEPWPQPAGREFHLTCSFPEGKQPALQLMDVLGRTVYASGKTDMFGGGVRTFTVPTAGLPAGFYLLKASPVNGQPVFRKIVIWRGGERP